MKPVKQQPLRTSLSLTVCLTCTSLTTSSIQLLTYLVKSHGHTTHPSSYPKAANLAKLPFYVH